MQNWRSASRLAALGALLIVSGALEMSIAVAQDSETEPNQPCANAQNLGAIPLPYGLAGSLDSTPDNPDVDFFRFVGTPGALIRIDLEGATTGKGTLGDPYLGAFDSSCNLIAANDDFNSLNSRLALTIPPDGVLILGATNCCDGAFLGGGIGTYQLSVSYFVAVRSISGRLIDAVTRQPLKADSDFPFVRLLRCADFGCFDVSYTTVGNDGRFLFSRDFGGQLLETGRYQIVATANEYEPGQTDPTEIFEEDRDLGDIALQPFPIRFSDIRPCVEVPAQGGKCLYSVRVTNRLGTRLSGAAWSLVNASGTGSLADFTAFQTDQPRKFKLDALEGKVFRFEFDVPATVRAGASICAGVLVGDDRREPLFNTVAQSFLFCISKSFEPAPTLKVVPRKEANKLFRQLDGRRLAPPKDKSR